ncbi:MAG: bacillithiol biosynthesis BshC [Anaerolineae bacterium]|nr:bacillithiol biosynthesis BshC [Gemmatimonadaceae bacterium]
MSPLRVITEKLGGSALARAALEEKTPVTWYRRRPDSASAWRDHMATVRRRFASSNWLSALLPALRPEGAARERLDRVSDGAGVLITTGQQAGLFGGPIYTWSKAVSALAMADSLEASTGIPTAPVFWAATDDADFAEASITHVSVAGGLETLRLPEPAQLGVSMRDTPLGDVTDLVRALGHGAGSATYSAILEQVASVYEPRATVGSAYVELLRAVLEPLGITVLDAGHPSVREAARPLLINALRESRAIQDALERRQQEILAGGFEEQVQLVRGLSLVFESGVKGRERVSIQSSLEVAAKESAALGSTALIRPLLEQALLPTASYVAGPAEIAYFAQTGAVADAIGVDRPMVLPRWACCIIEPHIDRLLSRYGFAREELANPHSAETRIARDALPAAIGAGLVGLTENMRASVDALRDAFRKEQAKLDVSPAVADGFQRDVQRRIVRLDRRIVAAAKRSQLDARRDIATMRAALYPLGKPQERVLNLIPLLARHGPALLSAMLDRAREHASDLIPGSRGESGSLSSAGEVSATPS